MSAGVRSTDFDPASMVDEVLANVTQDGITRTVRIPTATLGAQIAQGAGAIVATKVKATLAQLDAVKNAMSAGDIGLVVFDPDEALRGQYALESGVLVKKAELTETQSQQYRNETELLRDETEALRDEAIEAAPSTWLTLRNETLAAKDAAAGQATASTAARVLSEAARDASTVAAGPVYLTEAAGIAAVVNGAQFVSLSSDGQFFEKRQRTSSVASTLIATYPTTAFSTLIATQYERVFRADVAQQPDDDLARGYAWIFAMDDAGRVAGGVLDDGSFVVHAMGNVTFAVDADGYTDTYVWAIRDEAGKGGIALRRDGLTELQTPWAQFDGATLTLGGSGVANLKPGPALITEIATMAKIAPFVGPERRVLAADTFLEQVIDAGKKRVFATAGGLTRPYILRTDLLSTTYLAESQYMIAFLAAGGQSLSVGGTSGPIFNTIAPAPQHALMFNGGSGPRGPQGTTLNAASLTDFIPLQENGLETQGSGMTSWLYRKSRVMDEVQRAFLFQSHGIGGRTIAELSKGSISDPAFANAIKQVTRAVAIAAAYGKQVWVPSVFFTQGEQDRSPAATTRGAYLASMLQLQLDYDADMRALLPAGNGTIRLLVDQLSAASTGGSAGAPALAQYDAAKANSNIRLTTPKYIFPMSDNVHLLALSYALLGEYQAKVWRRLNLEGEDWKPLWPTAVNRAGNSIVIDFNVPRGGLVFDTSLLPMRDNFGFEYRDDSNSAAIVGVTKTGPKQVTLTLSTAPTGANKLVRYAYSGINLGAGTRSGAWGNLRDQDNEPSFQIPGRYLHNYCVTFEEPIA